MKDGIIIFLGILNFTWLVVIYAKVYKFEGILSAQMPTVVCGSSNHVEIVGPEKDRVKLK